MEYYLVLNHLIEAGNYSARVKTEMSHNLASIIERMLSKRNLVSETDIVAVLHAFFEEIEACVKAGENVTTPIFTIGYSISGVFDDDEDNFDEDRHALHINTNTSTELKKIIPEIPLKKVEATNTLPVIRNLTDIATTATNDRITPSNIFQITGERLKIDGEPDEVGLWFVAADGTKTKVEYISTNANKQLAGLVPPTLVAGDYTLLLKTKYISNSSTLKNAKTAVSSFTVTVL